MKKTIGIVAALPGEARTLAGHPCRQKANGFLNCRTVLKDETHLMVVQSGMGMKNAFSAALWLSEKGVAALGCFGVSGGLNPLLKTGDVLFADVVLGEQHDDVSLVWKKDGGHSDEPFKCIATKGLPVQWGPIISVQKPVLDAAGKRALFDRTKALAVDMETAAVARAANQSGLPFFAVRIICDPVNVSVPETLFQCVDEKGNPRFFYLLNRIIQKPSLIIHLLSMKRNFDTALASAAHVRHCLAEMHISSAP
jgi:adenosylhomocysteine nucleosidase